MAEALRISGNVADYGWGPTEDGKGIVVWKGDWFQILDAGAKMAFNDATVDTATRGTHSGGSMGTGGGTTASNVLAGKSSDYGWGPTEDGQGMVVWKGDWFQIFEAGSTVTFDNGTVGISADRVITTNLTDTGWKPGDPRPAEWMDAVDDAFTGDAGKAITGNILTNDRNFDAATVRIVIDQQPANGTLTVNPDGTFTYEPKAGFSGTDAFAYTIEDECGCNDKAVVKLTVDEPDQPSAPTASIGDRVWLDTDEDGLQGGGEQGVAGVTVELRDAAGKVVGTATTDANGNYLFDELAGGQYTVKVTAPSQYGFTSRDAGNDAADSDVDTATGQTGSISLEDDEHIRTVDAGLVEKPVPNKPPVAHDDNGEVPCWDKDGININVLANDTDADGDKLTATLKGQPANGTVSQNADGTFAYKPKDGFTGKDVFTYSVSDGNGGTSEAKVTVNVEAPTQVKASIVGADTILEGDKQNYKVVLDKAVDEDTYYTVHVADGSAKYVDGNTPGVASQDILWGGQRSVLIDAPVAPGLSPYWTVADNRVYENGTYHKATGPTDVSWDFSTFKDGKASGRDIVVKVPAGQTQSESFEIDAWKEKVQVSAPIYGREGGREGDETFKLSITEIDGSGDCEVITAGPDKTVTIKDQTPYQVQSPIALDLNHDGHIGVTGATTSREKDPNAALGRTVEFDIDGDGDVDTTEWFKGDGDGILVDTSKIGPDGEIDGKALFGNEGGTYANGYDKLKLFDQDGDGMVSGAELAKLGVWVDDGNAKLEAGEMTSAADAGVAAISTDMKTVLDQQGAPLMQSSAFDLNGHEILTEDVWFATASHDAPLDQPVPPDHHQAG